MGITTVLVFGGIETLDPDSGTWSKKPKTYFNGIENPFDVLIEEAMGQHRKGKTMGLRKFIKKYITKIKK